MFLDSGAPTEAPRTHPAAAPPLEHLPRPSSGPNYGFGRIFDDFLEFSKITIWTRKIKVAKSVLEWCEWVQGMRGRLETTPGHPGAAVLAPQVMILQTS